MTGRAGLINADRSVIGIGGLVIIANVASRTLGGCAGIPAGMTTAA